jgi:hypothetical protein
MKKLGLYWVYVLCIVLAFVVPGKCDAQNPPQKVAQWYEFTGVTVDTVFRLPVTRPFQAGYLQRGDIAYQIADSNTYVWTGFQWRCISCGSGYALALKPGDIAMGNQSGVAVDTPFFQDIATLPQISEWFYGVGVNSTNTVTNYSTSNLDSIPWYYTTVPLGTKYGGMLNNSISGDSTQTQMPFIVTMGHSIIAGHPWNTGGWENNNLNQWDVNGQIGYLINKITHIPVKDMGRGGQTSAQIRARWPRDVLGQTANPNDGKGSVSIGRPPFMCILDAAINSIAISVPLQSIQEDYIWEAQSCVDNGIRLIVYTEVGDITLNQSQLKELSDFNFWLRNGGLNQYGVVIVDLNAFWNSGSFFSVTNAAGKMNSVGGPYVNTGDGVHLTVPGYDTTAVYTVSIAKIPTLDSVGFYMSNSGTNPIANYNRPATATISGNLVTIPNASYVSVPITFPLLDTPWITTKSSVNVSGSSTVSGYNSIRWHLSNNSTNQVWYTRSYLNKGSYLSNPNSSTLTLQVDRYANGVIPLNVLNSDMSYAFQIISNSGIGNATAIFNGGALSNVALLGAKVSSYGPTTTLAYAGQGGINVGGIGSTIGPFQIGQPNHATQNLAIAFPSANTGMSFESAYGYGVNGTSYIFQNPNGPSAINSASTSINNGVSIIQQYSNINANGDTLNIFNDDPGVSDTSSLYNNKVINVMTIEPVIGNHVNDKINGMFSPNWDELLNTVSGNMFIGVSKGIGSAKLQVGGTQRGFMPPRLTMGQRDSIGYVSSITVTSSGSGYIHPPSATLSGGDGNGATLQASLGGSVISINVIEPGQGYKTSVVPSVVLSGGGGTGATATAVLHSPDSGLVIWLIDSATLQVYNGSAWISIPGTGACTCTAIPWTDQNPVSGGTVAMTDNAYNIVDPIVHGPIAALTFTFPASPSDKDMVEIKMTQAVTVATFPGNVAFAPSTLTPGYYKFKFVAIGGLWY